MPPQQRERLLDFIGQGLGFGAHGDFSGASIGGGK